jgi:hypothetical protein
LEAQIVPNQGNANLTIYSVGLNYMGSTANSQVIFAPQNITFTEPLPPNAFPNGFQDNSTGYYDIYSYSYFCQLVNTAFADALAQLIVLEPSIPPGTTPPFIKFDSITQLFSITAETPLYNQDSPNPINILFNNALYYLYYSFSAGRQVIGSYNYFAIKMNANTATINTTNNTITAIQEKNSTNLWDQIASIVITSQTLPVVRSQTFTPALFYAGVLEPNINNSLTQPILLEYSVEDSQYNKNITYNPTAQYKVFCLNSEIPLYNFDMKFYYRSTTGILKPIALNSGASMSVKIGFFKKSKYTHLKPMI